VPVLIPATMMLGGVSLLVTSAANAWGPYLLLLGLTGFALGLGWTLPSIRSQTVVDPARAGEGCWSQPHSDGDYRRCRRGCSRNADRARVRRNRRHHRRYPGGVAACSVLSLVGGDVLLAITLIGRGSRRSSEVASPAS
jgi:hypothetical protein